MTEGDDAGKFWDPEDLARAERERLQRQSETEAGAERVWKPNGAAGRARIVTATIVSGTNIAPKPYEWLWPDWLARGKLEILAGPVGTGKTTVAIDFAATITKGGVWPDGSRAQPGSVLVWSGEDAVEDTLMPRFLAAGGIRENIHFVGRVIVDGKPRAFNPSIDMPALIEATKDLPNLCMIIVDPVVLMVSGDSHKNTEVRRGLQPLVDFAAERNLIALGITHLTKGTAGRDPIERLTGSLAFGASPRLVMMAAKSLKPDEPRRLVRVKSNIGPDGDGFEYDLAQVLIPDQDGLNGQCVVWKDALYGSATDLLNGIELPNSVGRPSAKRSSTEAWLRDLLNDKPMPVTWIEKAAKDAGISWATVRRARDGLTIRVNRIGGLGEEGHWQWELIKDGNAGEEIDFC